MTPQEMDAVLEQLDRRLSGMDARMERVETRVTTMDDRLGRVEVSVQNLDRRTTSIEQILPTLATKQDLATLRGEMRGEMGALGEGLRAEMQKLNKETAETVKREARLLYEDLRDDIRMLAEHDARRRSGSHGADS